MNNSLKLAARSLALICGIAIMPGTSRAQSTPPSSPDPTPTNPAGQSRIAPGSVIPVQLTKTIDAKKAKAGDEVVAKVTRDMKAATGEVIVAKDTKMVGHVTEAHAHTKEQKQSELGITFDRAVTKSSETRLAMSIQAIIAPVSNPNAEAGSGGPGEPVSTGGTATSPMSGRAPLSPSTQPQPQSMPTGVPDAPAGSNARPPIKTSTQGVIGIPNLKLESIAQNAAQGSVLTSEKNNVRLESGTMLLLRVSQ
jgi:hypothetical protein